VEEDKFNKVKSLILSAIDKHISAADGKLIFGRYWEEKENACCPIYLCIDRELLKSKKAEGLTRKIHFAFRQALGFKIAELDMLAFIIGFDGIRDNSCGGDRMMFDLGQEFRVRFNEYILKEKDNDRDTVESS
jgi:hypothetical protein